MPSSPAMPGSSYPPLNVQVHTPRLSLLGATDELLERLVPTVRKGVATAPYRGQIFRRSSIPSST